VVLSNGYPFLLAVSIVLSTFTNNIEQLKPEDIILPILVVMALVSIFYWTIYLRFKDSSISGITTSIGLLIIFSFQFNAPVLRMLETINPNWLFHFRLLIVGVILFVLTFITITLLARILSKHQTALKFYLKFFNLFSVVFFTSQIFLIIARIHYFSDNFTFQRQWEQNNQKLSILAPLASSIQKRDIYVIILDSYPTTEVLQDLYGYDNTWFVIELETRGFFIVPQARSNYPQTRTSTNALLNMEYLDKLTDSFGEEYQNVMPLMIMLEQNKVMQHLEEFGYQTVTYETNYSFTDAIIGNVNHKRNIRFNLLNETILTKTIFYPLFHEQLYKNHGETILRSLKPTLYKDGPTFQFIHVYAPHTPFVFDRIGNPLTPEYIFTLTDGDGLHNVISTEHYLSVYPMQLEYISKQVLATIDYIKGNSAIDPIIILMGDHGPGAFVNQVDIERSNHFERMHILNALLLPGVDRQDIPDDITPVNTFRFIFNKYFKTNLPLLENRSFVSSYNSPYKFIDVTEILEADIH
jgi:hypothetical protein